MPQDTFSNNYSAYYDLLYKDKDYEKEAEYVCDLIKKENPVAENILELGSGTGNHAAIICKKGFAVTGIERSAEMAKLSAGKGIPNFKAVEGSIENFALPEKFDVAVSLFHVISYLTTNEQLIACFNAVHHHLKEKGVFIFDVWYSPAVYHQKPETRIKRMENDHISVIRIAEPESDDNNNTVLVNYEIIIEDKISSKVEFYKEIHPMRHFSVPEIELLANHTGFTVKRTEEFMTGNKAGRNTWGVCFILQKK